MAAYLSNDKGLLEAARTGKDVYSSIAAIAFNKTYEECCEFNPDGSFNKAGKERRSQAKIIVLGKRCFQKFFQWKQMPLYIVIYAEKVSEPYYSGVCDFLLNNRANGRS